MSENPGQMKWYACFTCRPNPKLLAVRTAVLCYPIWPLRLFVRARRLLRLGHRCVPGVTALTVSNSVVTSNRPCLCPLTNDDLWSVCIARCVQDVLSSTALSVLECIGSMKGKGRKREIRERGRWAPSVIVSSHMTYSTLQLLPRRSTRYTAWNEILYCPNYPEMPFFVGIFAAVSLGGEVIVHTSHDPQPRPHLWMMIRVEPFNVNNIRENSKNGPRAAIIRGEQVFHNAWHVQVSFSKHISNNPAEPGLPTTGPPPMTVSEGGHLIPT